MSRWQMRIAVLLVAGVVMGQVPVEASTKTAEAVLETLAVKGRAPKTGYERSQFGPAWSDVDRNGCDTRNDILYRDLTSIDFKAGTHDCVVLSGILVDPYSGEKISFERGVKSSMDVQIDHVVALSNAWQTGAFKLSYEKRREFANDPMNLLAVLRRLSTSRILRQEVPQAAVTRLLTQCVRLKPMKMNSWNIWKVPSKSFQA